jgi:hypothetical protein
VASVPDTVTNKARKGLVWKVPLTRVIMEPHHVRFEKAVSECDSESSWYSYISTGRVCLLLKNLIGQVLRPGEMPCKIRFCTVGGDLVPSFG